MILLILGNGFLQKQQFDLANQHYLLLYKYLNLEQSSFLNLVLAVVNLSQAYQRTNANKEQSVRRAIAFLVRYADARADKLEVRFNIARAMHQMGLIAIA